jgi:hypothetical protein
VRLTSDGAQNRQTLRRHLNSVLAKEVRRIVRHPGRVDQILE